MIHDRNVRVAGATGPAARRPARRWGLARLLLESNRTVATAVLAALFSPMLACVIPAAPDFQDPISSPNVAPWLHDPYPAFGQIVSVPPMEANSQQGYPISVSVTDLNAADVLHARWIINYPLYQGANTYILSEQTLTRLSPTEARAEFKVQCVGGWTSNPAPQQLELVVADGPFAYPVDARNPDVVAGDTRKSYANWTLIMPCSSSSTSGTSP